MAHVSEVESREVKYDVFPTHDDRVVWDSSEAAGGPAGSRVRAAAGWWTPVRVALVMAMLTFTLGVMSKLPCRGEGSFLSDSRYTKLCYSDISFLYQLRGFAKGFLPYFQTDPNGEALEYPVLTGFFMQIASWLTGTSGSEPLRALRFYDWNIILLSACLMVAVACTSYTVRRRPWDAAMFALAPGVLFASIINWDLLAVALTAGFFLAWSRNRPALAGILLGLAIAAKFYPLLILGPLLLVCWRASRWRDFRLVFLSTLVTWTVVNLPVLIASPSGWAHFYSFSADRGADFGSPWLVLRVMGHEIPAQSLNKVALACLLLACIGVAAIAWRAPKPARLAQMSFLVIAAFCLTNKVYSPQYVLWLIPLAVLARPRWRDFLIWQAGEVVYFLAVWWYLEGLDAGAKGLPEQWYAAAIVVHIATTLWFCGVVVRDMLRPAHDPLEFERVEATEEPLQDLVNLSPVG